jgi:hypothetical protein
VGVNVAVIVIVVWKTSILSVPHTFVLAYILDILLTEVSRKKDPPLSPPHFPLLAGTTYLIWDTEETFLCSWPHL